MILKKKTSQLGEQPQVHIQTTEPVMEQPRDAQTQSSPPQHWQVQQQYQEPVQAQPLGQHSHDPDYLHEDNRLGIPGTHINPLPLAVGRYGDLVKYLPTMKLSSSRGYSLMRATR